MYSVCMNPFRLRLCRACSHTPPSFCFGILGILLTIMTGHGWGASSDYLIDVWRAEGGLRRSSVTSIAQTPEIFRREVGRGVPSAPPRLTQSDKFEAGSAIQRRAGDSAPYLVQASTNNWQILRPPGMSSGTLCAEDSAGILWGRGRDQKLWRYRNDAFELMRTNSGLQGSVISCLVADPKGRIWVGTDKEIAKW